jgi:predicted RNA methylase
MAKLTKAEAKAHAAAMQILRKDVLTWDDRWAVLEGFHEGANHVNGAAGAFFTPPDLAHDYAIDAMGGRVIDLCAGIGTLAMACLNRWRHGGEMRREFVCIERNPDYVAIGRKILPEATWICADVFDIPSLGLGHFDCALGNPPFGATPRNGRGPRYSGRTFEFHVMDLACDIADYGAFIIPQMSAPFQYSGSQNYRERRSDDYNAFHRATGIELTAGCGVDCDYHKDGWKGVSPKVEIVCADFEAARASRVDRTPAGAQIVLPGAAKISKAEHAARLAAAPLRPRKAQAACDLGLFSDDARQADLVDMARR